MADIAQAMIKKIDGLLDEIEHLKTDNGAFDSGYRTGIREACGALIDSDSLKDARSSVRRLLDIR